MRGLGDFRSIQHDWRMPYLVRVAIPSTGHPAPSRALRHPWLRLSQHERGTH